MIDTSVWDMEEFEFKTIGMCSILVNVIAESVEGWTISGLIFVLVDKIPCRVWFKCPNEVEIVCGDFVVPYLH